MRGLTGMPWEVVLILALAVGMLLLASQETAAQQINGIVVDRPKQFSYTQLEGMIAELEAQLAQIQVIDPQAIQAAVGTTQGWRSRATEFSLTAQGSPTPGVTTNFEADEEGALVPKTATVTEAATTPTVPSASAAPSSAVTPQPLGLSATQVLSEQRQLQYEIYNLRLLQQRSISDRFFSKDGEEGSRVLALIGVTVSITPTTAHRKMAAIVELTLAPESGQQPSLVALMPDKKTFNAVSHSTRSNAFGGAAMAGVVNLGFAGKWKNEQLFLYQDSDTVAYRVSSDSSQSVRFGWQFRPVLGNKLVEPGERHLYAVVALDQLDTTEKQEFPVSVTASTRWHRYSTKKRATWGGPVGPWEAMKPWTVKLANSAKLHEGLSPRVQTITVDAIGTDEVLVKVKAENLFRGATVKIGRRTLVEGVDLTHRPGGLLEFVAPIREIMDNDVRIIGAEYGFSASLEVEVSKTKKHTGIRVEAFTTLPRRQGDHQELEILLSAPEAEEKSRVSKKSCSGERPELDDRSVYVTYGDGLYELPPERWVPSQKPGCISVLISVPKEDVEKNTVLRATIPFLGDLYTSAATYYVPEGVTGVEVLEVQPVDRANAMTMWGLIGWGLATSNEDNCKHKAGPDFEVIEGLAVYAGQRYAKAEDGVGLEAISPELVTLTAPTSELQKVEKVVVVIRGHAEPITLKAPAMRILPMTPSVAGDVRALQHSSAGVLFKGRGLTQIKSVTFEGTKLEIQQSADGLRVFLPRAVTEHKGPVNLLAEWGEGKLVVLGVEIY